MAENARIEAVKILQKLHLSHSYSHIALDNLLRKERFSDAERALLSRLVYGVEERRLTLDHMLACCCTRSLARLHPTVLEILRVGAYQLLFMDRIPVSAAVNEAVKATRSLKQGAASGFVNGVLRALDRKKAELWDTLGNDIAGLSIRYSCPRETISLWMDSYGEERTLDLLKFINETPPTVLRLNSLRTTPAEWRAFALQEEIAYHTLPSLENSVVIEGGIARRVLDKFGDRYYYQDGASQYCVAALSPQIGERLADVCAAPGGKSFTAAQEMQNDGYILCGDIHGEKCDTIIRRAREFGITIVDAVARDASKECPRPLHGRFDRVICDVPCSGLGVIRRKPEIRYKSLSEFAELPKLQYQILEQASRMVRPGGVLQYSTCTLNPAENEMVVRRFAAEHPEFTPRILPITDCFTALGIEPDWYITLFPPVHGTDGFFIAGFTRNEDPQ